MSLITSKKILTLIVVVNQKDGKVLLGMKKRGFGANKWNGFGGKLEGGETIEEGARRELFEEAEIKAIDMKRVGMLMFTFDKDPVGLETHIFKSTAYEGSPTETEEMKPAWYTYDQIPYDHMWSDDRYWFPYILNGQLFTGHFHFGQDQKTILKHDLKIIDGDLSEGFNPSDVTL